MVGAVWRRGPLHGVLPLRRCSFLSEEGAAT
jgi:hypothetical protein